MRREIIKMPLLAAEREGGPGEKKRQIQRCEEREGDARNTKIQRANVGVRKLVFKPFDLHFM